VAIEHETPPEYPDDGEADFHEKHDIKENLESTPPAGEEVRLPHVMVAECFVGGDLEDFVAGCRDLDFPDDRSAMSPMSIFSWAKQVRETSGSGGWLTVGAVSASSEHRLMGQVKAELPPEFDYVLLKAIAPTPSIVVLVATCRLTPDAAGRVDEELRTNRYLRLEKRGTTTFYNSAIHRKSAAVRAERTRIREAASTWLAQTFAGTLSRDFDLATLPAIEFLTLALNVPFSDEFIPMRDYRGVLSIDSDSDAWASADAPGWRIGEPWRPTDGTWALVAACRLPEPEGDAEDGVEPAPDPRLDPMPSRTHRLGETFDGLLVRFALSCLIVQYEQKLGRLRDDVATNTAGGTSIRSAVEVVDRVRQTVSTLSFDASLVAHDLIAFSGDASRWTWEVIEPLPLAAYRQSDDGESASLCLSMPSPSPTGRPGCLTSNRECASSWCCLDPSMPRRPTSGSRRSSYGSVSSPWLLPA
jgi:hypothetical protein